MIDLHFGGQGSTLFSALFVTLGAESAGTLGEDGHVIRRVREAFGHGGRRSMTSDYVSLRKEVEEHPGIQDLTRVSPSRSVVRYTT